MGTRGPRIAALAAAIVLIVAGVAAGQHLDVLAQGVRVCLQCMGIG